MGVQKGEKADNAARSGDDVDQARLHLHRQRRRARREYRQEAGELDAVAQPMIAAHQAMPALIAPPAPYPALMIGPRLIVPAGPVAAPEVPFRNRPGRRQVPRPPPRPTITHTIPPPPPTPHPPPRLP